MSPKLVDCVQEFTQELNQEYQLTHIQSREDLLNLIDGEYLINTPKRKTMPKLGPCQFVGYALHKKLEKNNIPSKFIAQKIVEQGHNFLHFLVQAEDTYIELLKNIYVSNCSDLVLQKKRVSEIKDKYVFSIENFPEEYTQFWNSNFTKDWAGRYSEKHLLQLYAKMPEKESVRPNYELIISNILQ
jgi:hypothetical protein